MADKEQMKKTAAQVLVYVEKVSCFFASNINPLFGIVTAVSRVARKGLTSGEDHALEKDFSKINNELERISMRNQEALKQIKIDEVNEIFGKYEERIKRQFAALTTMVERVQTDPVSANDHMEDFKNIYERHGDDLALKVYYDGVMDKDQLFGRPLLEVYLEHCNNNRKVMEHRCSHLIHLFSIGIMSLMAYTYVTEDDEDEIRVKWAQRVKEIQAKMEEALSQCKKN